MHIKLLQAEIHPDTLIVSCRTSTVVHKAEKSYKGFMHNYFSNKNRVFRIQISVKHVCMQDVYIPNIFVVGAQVLIQFPRDTGTISTGERSQHQQKLGNTFRPVVAFLGLPCAGSGVGL